jgi:nucleotide-binding universal stress UspA family protein
MPWPPGANGFGVMATDRILPDWPLATRAAVGGFQVRCRERAEDALRRRWPSAAVRLEPGAPGAVILAEARRRRARVIAVGPRAQSALDRALLGSVALEVLRHAPCSVLVARGRLASPLRAVVGLDGSPASARAVRLLRWLTPGGEVTLVRAVTPVRVPSGGLLPASIRASLAGQARAQERAAVAAARRGLERAAAPLRRLGWRVRIEVRVGRPEAELLAAVRAHRASLLVVGARGAGAAKRLFLGSVSDGLARRSPTSVLVAR